MYRNIVFFGNCQADVLRKIFTSAVSRYQPAEARYVNSALKISAQDELALLAADVIVMQVFSSIQVGAVGNIPVRGKIIKFPLISGHFLWPYYGAAHPVYEVAGFRNPFHGSENSDERLNQIISSSKDKDGDIVRYYTDNLAKSTPLDRTV